MYSVILVEDEMLIRMGLRNSIDWNKYDMEVVADFTNGNTALEYYETHKPDIIITDLKMRVMDGMELIARIREKDSETRIIILTCLEEFELVRKALSMGVSDYMLKLTMSEEEIDKVLKKTRNEINKRNTNRSQRDHSMASTDLERERYLKDFLFYNLYSTDEFMTFTKKNSLNLMPQHLVLCILDIDNYETFKSRFEDKKGHLIRASMLNVLNEVLDNCKCGEAFYDEDAHYIILFSFEKITSAKLIHNELINILSKIRNAVNMCFNISLSIGISNEGNGYECLKRMYSEAHEALSNKFFIGPGVTCYTGIEADKVASAEKMAETLHSLVLYDIVGHDGLEEFNYKTEAFLKELPTSRDQFEIFFQGMVHWISATTCLALDDSVSIPIIANERLKKSATLDAMISTFTYFIENINKKGLVKRILSDDVTAAIEYLDSNFKSDIKLQNVADHVRLSPNYLGYLFKKELHVNITEYLTQLRVKKAKKLLKNTTMRSYEIADMTGFSDNAYFSKVFKKSTGSNPNEFRKQYWKNCIDEADNEDR